MLVQWEPVDLETVANESDRCSPLPLDPTMVVAVKKVSLEGRMAAITCLPSFAFSACRDENGLLLSRIESIQRVRFHVRSRGIEEEKEGREKKKGTRPRIKKSTLFDQLHNTHARIHLVEETYFKRARKRRRKLLTEDCVFIGEARRSARR